MDASVQGPVATAIAGFYLVTNATRVFSYLPQIVAVWRCRDGAFAISILTWGLWTISHVASLLYGALVMHDLYFVGITTINLVGCSVVTALAVWRRAEFRRAQAQRGETPPARPATRWHRWSRRLQGALAPGRRPFSAQRRAGPAWQGGGVALDVRAGASDEPPTPATKAGQRDAC